MKAHATRRAIWFLNVALVAALVGIGAWYFLDVRGAIASVPVPGPDRKAPPQFATIVKGFHKDLDEARTDVLSAPVRQATLKEVILIEKFKDTDPTHFIFTGPPPPEKMKEPEPTGPAAPPLPKGLAALGMIDWLIYQGEDTVIAFLFKSNKTGYFKIGEFVHEGGEPRLFKIVAARQAEPGFYKIAYETWEPGKDAANEVEGDLPEIEWDNRKAKPKQGEGIIYIDPKTLSTPAGDGTTDGTAEGEGEAGDAPGEPVADGSAETTRVEPVAPVKPTDELTFEDLKPEVKRVNARQYKVEFDDNTRRYFSRKGAKELAETVKTQIAKDKLGNVIGLRLVDPGEAPADVLQLRRGDIIVMVDGQPVKDRSDIVRIAEGIDENTDRISIVVDRLGNKITFHVDPRDPKTRRVAGAYADRELR